MRSGRDRVAIRREDIDTVRSFLQALRHKTELELATLKGRMQGLERAMEVLAEPGPTPLTENKDE